MNRKAANLEQLAREQFEPRSARYQGSFSQRVYCRPTSRILLDRLDLKPGARVLDVGCGTGQLLADIRERFPTTELTGLDLCEGMLRSARTLLGPGAELVQGESQQLPFPESHFDAVVCTHCFHHFPEPLKSVREMRRVLRDGGRVFVLDGDRDPWWGRLLYDVFVVLAEGPVHHHSADEMQQLMRASGLEPSPAIRAFPLSPVLLTIGTAARGATRHES